MVRTIVPSVAIALLSVQVVYAMAQTAYSNLESASRG
jgi:hypothetical protein